MVSQSLVITGKEPYLLTMNVSDDGSGKNNRQNISDKYFHFMRRVPLSKKCPHGQPVGRPLFNAL